MRLHTLEIQAFGLADDVVRRRKDAGRVADAREVITKSCKRCDLGHNVISSSKLGIAGVQLQHALTQYL